MAAAAAAISSRESPSAILMLSLGSPECSNTAVYRCIGPPQSHALGIAAVLSPFVPFVSWPDEVTPKDIARALSISDKTLRQWLRDNRAAGHDLYERWVFTPREADEIVASCRDHSGVRRG